MKLLFLTAALFLMQAVIAQKTIHDPNAEVRKISGSFTSIEVSGGIDLYLSKGDGAVAVSAKDAESRDRIITEVKNGVLVIRYDTKSGVNLRVPNKQLKAYVSYQQLERLTASGGSDIQVDGDIKGGNLVLSVTSGSDFKGSVDVETMVVEQAGGSDIDIRGIAKNIAIQASSGSDFDGYGLVTENCSADASSGSDINITVNRELSAEASSGSDINWKGSATVKKSRTSSSSSISHRS